MSIVDVQNLTHGFGDKTVLRDVSFRMMKEEHIGLTGPNGAGKSTLLNILTGQLLPDAGDITWHPNVKAGNLQQHINLNTGDSIRTFLQGAFSHLFHAEKEMLSLTEEMGDLKSTKLNSALKKYSDLQTWLEQSNFYGIDATIEDVAAGLGLTQLGMDTDVGSLSGGQRTKLLLAKLLLQKPDLLLLDEPTNYLDTAHIEWLTSYLKDYPHAFLLITHDTHFMNEVVHVIFHLEHQRLTRYTGNYIQFEAAYKLRRRQIHQQFERQQEEIKKLEIYVQKNKARASTAKQAKSREKKLQKIERIEKPTSNPPARFSFSVSHEPESVLLQAENLSIGYESALFSSIHLKLERGAKVALTGHNGIGKTTTLKTLLSEISTLGGAISLGERVLPAYFEQEFHSHATHTALDEIWSAYPDLMQKEVRKKLARCGLKTEHIFQPLHSLSGGEQTKVRLCKLMLASSNLLVLDEPTNHLDINTKEALQEALIAYDGTILLVSHEPSFYEGWVTEVWDMEKWI
ncbi:ABC-F family ATP-binding cassette domain-containing protein [Virgibacillus oceani]